MGTGGKFQKGDPVDGLALAKRAIHLGLSGSCKELMTVSPFQVWGSRPETRSGVDLTDTGTL